MKSQKLRRHSGRVSPKLAISAKKEEILDNCLEPQEHWDDWKDYRDGFRWSRDRTQLRSRFMLLSKKEDVDKSNKRLKKLILRRVAKKVRNKEKISMNKKHWAKK